MGKNKAQARLLFHVFLCTSCVDLTQLHPSRVSLLTPDMRRHLLQHHTYRLSPYTRRRIIPTGSRYGATGMIWCCCCTWGTAVYEYLYRYIDVKIVSVYLWRMRGAWLIKPAYFFTSNYFAKDHNLQHHPQPQDPLPRTTIPSGKLSRTGGEIASYQGLRKLDLRHEPRLIFTAVQSSLNPNFL